MKYASLNPCNRTSKNALVFWLVSTFRIECICLSRLLILAHEAQRSHFRSTLKDSISFEVSGLDEGLELSHWHAFLVTVLALRHGFLDDRGNLLRRLRQHFVHVLCHGVHVAEVLES